ncbi:MAG: hypothetical protein ABIS50_15130 [Luteolibacter sp.]|uniref:hypothetical protein n=1 Tax=Luteolibacter sp. TaxID=1962973 RepID=UPI0032666130
MSQRISANRGEGPNAMRAPDNAPTNTVGQSFALRKSQQQANEGMFAGMMGGQADLKPLRKLNQRQIRRNFARCRAAVLRRAFA